MKKTAGLLLLAVVIFTTVFITRPTSAAEYSEDKLANVSRDCESIKLSLSQLQRADSDARSSLGLALEAVSANYLTPLSVRLVKNNYPATDFLDLKNTFATSKNAFSDNYIKYAKNLEDILKINCVTDPSGFLDKLSELRTSRQIVSHNFGYLTDLIEAHKQQVRTLRSSLR